MKSNRRKLKNIIMIAAAVILIAALVFSTGIIKVGGGDMPGGEDMPGGGQPPQMQSESGDSEVTKLPDKEDGQEPPEKPDGEDMPETADGQEPPEKPDGMAGGMGMMRFVIAGAEALLLSLIIMYLAMSGFNRKTFRETLPDAKKKTVYVVTTLILGAVIFAAASFVPMKLMGPGGGAGVPGDMPGGSQDQVTQLDDADDSDDSGDADNSDDADEDADDEN